MAKTYQTQFMLGAKVHGSLGKGFGMVQKNLRGIQRQSALTQRAVTGMAGGFKKLIGIAGAYLGMRAVIGFAKGATEAAKAQIEAETKLAVIMRQRAKASDEQIQSILKLTSAQQKLGVIGDEVQIAGAQQLGTFVTQTKSLETLIPAMNNLLAQQKGLKSTQEDAVNIGNLMGKVFVGQVGALRKVGISFSKAQEQVLKYGNEQQKAAMLATVITENVGQMNEALAQTDQGKIKQAENRLGDLQEEIGKKIIPLQVKFAELFLKVIPYVEKLLPYLDKIPVGFDLILGAMNEVGKSEAIQFLATNVVPLLGQAFQEWMPKIMLLVKNTWGLIQAVIKAFGPALVVILPILQRVIGSVFDILNGVITFLTGVFSGNWSKAWEGISQVFVSVFKLAANNFITMINLITGAINKIEVKAPKWVPKIGGQKIGFNIPQIPMLAKGTNNWRGGLAIAGERGAELINMPRGSSVTPAGKTKRLLDSLAGNGGGPSFSFAPQVIIQGSATKDDVKAALDQSQAEFERRIEAYFRRRQRLSFA